MVVCNLLDDGGDLWPLEKLDLSLSLNDFKGLNSFVDVLEVGAIEKL